MKKVRDIMYIGLNNPTVNDTSCFRDVLEAMDNITLGRSLGVVSVADEQDRLIGIVTDGDLRRLLLRTQGTLPELFMKRVTSIMTENPKTVFPDTSLEACLSILEQHRLWVVPVADRDHKLLGVVHLHTLLKAMAK